MRFFSRALGSVSLALALVAVPACQAAASHDRQVATNRIAARAAVSAPGNPGVFDLPDPTRFDRVVAISDVHGMAIPLARLLAAAHVTDAAGHWAGARTLLLDLGDSIDKGPQSIEVLDTWLALAPQAQAAGGQVVTLLGNHEGEFLAAGGADSKAQELLAELAARHIPITDLTDPTRPRGALLANSPLAARVGRWLFCHAGLLPNTTWEAFSAQARTTLQQGDYGSTLLQADDSILEARDWWKDPAARQALEARLQALGFNGVVHGHQPKAYGILGRVGAVDSGHIFKIDSGMAPEAGGNAGEVLVFPRPAELMATGFPHAIAIGADGQEHAIASEAAQLGAATP